MSIPILPETWQKDRPWRKYLTEKEMKSLHPTAIVMADYWTKWLPKTCKRIQSEGTNLREFFDRKGNEYANLLIDLMQQGLAEDQAWEIVREEMFLPPEEQTSEDRTVQQEKVSTQHAAEILQEMVESLHSEMEINPDLRKKYKAAEERLSPLMGDAIEELSKAEIAGLQAIVSETHSELVKGIPPAVISPKCNLCTKRSRATCSLYPNGIPKDILLNRQTCEAFQEK